MSGKTTVYLGQCRKTAFRNRVVTFDTAKHLYYSERNTICLKDFTFLFMAAKTVEWRAVNDCYGTSLQLVRSFKHNCF